MSELRRRVLGSLGVDESSADSSPSISREASPAPEQKDGTEYKVVPTKRLEKLKEIRRKGTKRRNAWIFALGSIFGIFVAGYFASSNGNFDSVLDMAGVRDLRLDMLLDVLPAGLVKDVQDIQVCCNSTRTRGAPLADVDKGHVMAGRREASGRLRLFQDRSCCEIGRRGGQIPSDNDPGRHFHGSRKLGHRGAISPILQEEVVGFVDDDESYGAGQSSLEKTHHAGQGDRT